MDQKIVRTLERELERAITDVVIVGNTNWRFPLMPSQQTIHFMSKAAVAVYEAAVDNERNTEQRP